MAVDPRAADGLEAGASPRVRAALLALAAAVVGGSGCAFDLVTARQELLPRAVADLKCAADKVQFIEVPRTLQPSDVTVKGCGREERYQLVKSKWELVMPFQQRLPGPLR